LIDANNFVLNLDKGDFETTIAFYCFFTKGRKIFSVGIIHFISTIEEGTFQYIFKLIWLFVEAALCTLYLNLSFYRSLIILLIFR
jgi:hypothetical protein